MAHPPLSWLKTFEVTARYGNLTTAASEIGLTQAAVSQQIKGLETQLGVQLFTREARGVRLTGVGTELYSSIVNGLAQIEQAVDSFTTKRSDRLQITCNASLAERWLMSRLPDFCRQYSDISIKIRTALWQTDTLGLKSDIDIFFAKASSTTGVTLIDPGRLVAVASKSWIIRATQNTSNQSEHIATVSGRIPIFDDWLQTTDKTFLKKATVLEVDSFYAALSLTESGLAATVAPELLVKDAVLQGRLQLLPPHPEREVAGYWCGLSERPTDTALIFRDWLHEQVERSKVPQSAVPLMR